MIELYGDWKSIERMDTHNQNFVICMAEKKFAEEEERNENCVIFLNRPEFKVAYAAYEGKLYDLIDPPANGNYFHKIRLKELDAKTYTRDRYQPITNIPGNTECVPVITKECNYLFKEKYRPICVMMEKGCAYMAKPKGEGEYQIIRYRYVGEVCEEEYSSSFHWQHAEQRVISNNVNVMDHDGDHLSVNITAENLINSLRSDLETTMARPYLPPAMKIDRVTWNGPATVVFWKDGTKTVVKCGDKDDFDKEKGLAMAFMKKVLGNKGNYYNYIRKWLPEEKPFSDPDPWKNVSGIFDSVTTEMETEVKVKDKYVIKLKNGTEIKCTREEVPFFMNAVQKFMKLHPDSQK